ncbi:MAG: hypothetical protein JKY37_19725 [Nannocystaceae bacterium]|nr:hypothetical protein [Nannocystaceae bacterium]
MAPRVLLRLVCLLGLASACAKGADPDSNGFTFGGDANPSTNQPVNSGTSADSGTDDGDTGSRDTTSNSQQGTAGSTESNADEGASGDCGNGVIDADEQCDGTDVGGGDCLAQGFAGGTLGCTAQCTIDTTSCVDTVCGDGVLQRGETCDCGMGGSVCTAAQLGAQTCTALPAPGGGNYSGGSLGCTPQCEFDASACTYCGDGMINAAEACDGVQIAGQTCTSQGFDAGTLSCAGTCVFETSLCINYVCGDGTCDPDEDSCTCPGDCPDDPNTCGDPCECGASGGNCYCDAACVSLGDCCPNGPC